MRRFLISVLSMAGLLTLAACQQAPQQAGFVVQVSLGPWDSADYTAAEVIGRIREVNALIPVRKVIIGWTMDKDIYRQVGEYLHQNDIKMFLWLPVFAETETVCENEPAVDLSGGIPANYDLTAGEGFRFNCPSRPETAANVVAIYDEHFKDCGFDGVFLDRIRTQSFVGGVSGVLSCGCPYCRELFKAEGVDLDAVLAAFNEKGDAFFSVTGYEPESGFTFADPVASAYFKAKGHVVSNAVAAIADSFHSRGLEVGMDLYAPFMAQFVGQDYGILSRHADFIKPMLYRQTFAPAGMGFEYELLRKAVPGAEGYPEFAMDVDFLDSQLKAMEPYSCGKYPGIEINFREKVVPTSPEYVTESLETVMRHGFDGAVLSWNIMEAPDSHIACLGSGTDPDDTDPNKGKDDLLELLRAEDKLYQDMTITSKVLNRKMTYSVWLPNGYDETKTYPFLYLLHGYESGDQAHLDRCWVEKGNARNIAKEYVKGGGVPMVIIMPNGLSMFYSGLYETYMHNELMPEVERLFNGNGKRAIAGLSMGGYGTTLHALKYPEKFTYAYAMSPAVSGDMSGYVDAKADKSVFPGFTFEVGNQDTTVDNASTKKLADYMAGQGIKVEYIARDGYHYWNFWQECLPKALKKAGESFK